MGGVIIFGALEHATRKTTLRLNKILCICRIVTICMTRFQRQDEDELNRYDAVKAEENLRQKQKTRATHSEKHG
jgi:superfamily II helicase